MNERVCSHCLIVPIYKVATSTLPLPTHFQRVNGPLSPVWEIFYSICIWRLGGNPFFELCHLEGFSPNRTSIRKLRSSEAVPSWPLAHPLASCFSLIHSQADLVVKPPSMLNGHMQRSSSFIWTPSPSTAWMIVWVLFVLP